MSSSAPEELFSTVDQVIETLYESTSYLPGDGPDWMTFQSLFLPGALVVSNASSAMSVPDFVAATQEAVNEGTERGYIEVEVARRVEAFGSVAQIFSTFEARYSPYDDKPINTGYTLGL